MRGGKGGRLAAALVLPLALMGLFRLLRGDRAVMDRWVFGVAAPVEQALGRLWSVIPWSGAEGLAVLFVLGSALWLVRAAVRLVRERARRAFLRRLLALAAVCLWLLAGLDWLWNAAYYASDFSQRSGLAVQPYSVDELARVTAWFAGRAGELCTQVERDGEGHFAVSVGECLERGVTAYDGLEEFSFLQTGAVRAKPLLCSRLQSQLGFTGIYFPFTGEANVNVDAPACLLPATIAHEMAHQRMVAAEEEANFVGIAACVTCNDAVYQYSGCLMGLIHLSNALYRADRAAWEDIRAAFPAALVTDWNDNNAYWAALESPLEDRAEQVYDSFLKGNGQELGMQSYGACVDLLVNWCREREFNNA